jgi:hypothetical protein
MQRSQCIHLEVEEWNGSCAVVRRLRRGVDDQIGTQLVDKRQQLIALADVQGSMLIAGDFAPQAIQYPTGIAFRSEKDRAMIAVNSMDVEAVAREEAGNLGTDQSARAGN